MRGTMRSIECATCGSSVAINTPGQSGDPASPHYRDLAPMWAAGGYFPLVYSRGAVEKATRARIELVPDRPGVSAATVGR